LIRLVFAYEIIGRS